MLDFQVSTIVFTVINLLVLYFILRKLLFGGSTPCWSSGRPG